MDVCLSRERTQAFLVAFSDAGKPTFGQGAAAVLRLVPADQASVLGGSCRSLARSQSPMPRD